MLSVDSSPTQIVLVAALMVGASVGGNLSTAHAQQSGGEFRMSPCQDSLYQELKERPLDQLSEREYEYLTRRDRACTRYKIARASSGDSLADGGRPSVCNEQRYRRVLKSPADSMEVRQLRFVVQYVQNCKDGVEGERSVETRSQQYPGEARSPRAANRGEPDTAQTVAREPSSRDASQTTPPADETRTAARTGDETDNPGRDTTSTDSSGEPVRPAGGEVELGSSFAGVAGVAFVSPMLRIGTSKNSYLTLGTTTVSHGSPNFATTVRGGVDILDGPGLLEMGATLQRWWPGQQETSVTLAAGSLTSGYRWTPSDDVAILPTATVSYLYPISLTIAGESVALDKFAAYSGESRGSFNFLFGTRVKLWDTLSLGLTDASSAVPAWYIGFEL